ncbi:MAG TPA: GNAT family protein [Gemmataceae bacterium]|nr:GNAT family protein [Gemmataceae bacterium]
MSSQEFAPAESIDVTGQPIGFALPNWTPPSVPAQESMEGRHCRLEPLNASLHAEPLYEAIAVEKGGSSWTYLPYGPFDSLESYRAWMNEACAHKDPMFFAIIKKPEGKPLGVASYLRITPASGAIEVGHIHYTAILKRTPAATEAMYLMMARAFDLGYRRYEWKCDSLNAASRAAAERLGFTFEGIFRQATVYKGRNRDTAWYAVIDRDWPSLRQAYLAWLAPNNFDSQGRQRTRLGDLMRTGSAQVSH